MLFYCWKKKCKGRVLTHQYTSSEVKDKTLALLHAIAAHVSGRNLQYRDHRLTLRLYYLTVSYSCQSVSTICHSPSYTSFANYSSRSVLCMRFNSSYKLQPLRLESLCMLKIPKGPYCAISS